MERNKNVCNLWTICTPFTPIEGFEKQSLNDFIEYFASSNRFISNDDDVKL